MELLNCLEQRHRLRCEKILFCVLVWGLLCNGFVIDLGIESEKVNSPASTAFKRFPFELKEANSSPHRENRDIVIEYLSRDIVGEILLERIETLKKNGWIRTTKHTNQITKEEFVTTDQLTVKEILYYLQFFPLLYKNVLGPIDFHVPIDGNSIIITLQRYDSGSFTAHLKLDNGMNMVDLSDINVISTQLKDAIIKINEPVILPKLIKLWSQSRLDSVNNYQILFPGNGFNHQQIKDGFLLGVGFFLSTSVFRKPFPSWIQDFYNDLEDERTFLEDGLIGLIRDKFRIKLRYELAANMVKMSEYYRGKWQELVNAGDIQIQSIINDYTTVRVRPTGRLTMRDFFKLLQYSLSFGLGSGKIRYIVPLGGNERTFYLSRALNGHDQIMVHTRGSDWPNGGKFVAPTYNGMLNLLKKVTDQRELAGMMAEATRSTLNNQPHFENFVQNDPSLTTPKSKANTVRAMVEFMVITMVAEAAAPSDTIKYVFTKNLADNIKNEAAFPEKNAMPHLAFLGEKSGRSPTMDDVVLEMLHAMGLFNMPINEMFSDELFPIRMGGGTQKGREYVHSHGNMLVPSYFIKNSARDIAIIARRSCTKS